MGGQNRTAHLEIARIAGRQNGNVTRAQLLDAGFSGREIDLRISRGLLILQFRGVYRVGHAAPGLVATYMAAVLACGPSSLLRGAAAGYLVRLLKRAPTRPRF